MTIDCYYNPMSSPSRAVLLTAKNLGVEMNLKLVNLLAGEHMQPQFLKMNPLHQVPTLNDSGFYLYESRAIMQYLANAYGSTENNLYPSDPKARFQVDQKLMFDQGTLYQKFADAYYPAAFQKKKIDPVNVKNIDEPLSYLNNCLSNSTFVAGNSLTIADFAIMASLSSMEACGHDCTSNYPAIQRYMNKCKKEIKGYNELNQQGADQYGQFIRAAIKRP